MAAISPNQVPQHQYPPPQYNPQPSSTIQSHQSAKNSEPRIMSSQQPAPSQASYRNSVREFCKDHPEEEVSYFCFDCRCPPICPECVIHGYHKGHNVSTLKKAFPEILKAVEELHSDLTSRVEDLMVCDQKVGLRRKEVTDHCSAAKVYMENAFEELRQKINKKEQQLRQAVEDKAEDVLAELDDTGRQIKDQQAKIEDELDRIQGKIKSQDAVVLA